jgi:hypothetical protein
MSNRLITVVGLVLAIVGLATISSCKREEEGGSPRIQNLPMNLPPTMPAGSAAITPHIAGTPAFSVDDAKQYVATHHVPMGLREDGKPVITRAEFLTSTELSDRLHGATTGFPSNYPLCYVELQGPVTFVGPQGLKITYNRGVLIFDARTGNLVIGGGIP